MLSLELVLFCMSLYRLYLLKYKTNRILLDRIRNERVVLWTDSICGHIPINMGKENIEVCQLSYVG